MIEWLIILTDKHRGIYFSFLYNIIRLSSYTRGFIDRNNVNLILKNKSAHE